MAKGIAIKRIDNFVPKMTSWRLARSFLRVTHGTLDTRDISDFLRREVDDMLWAVRLWPWPCLVSLVSLLTVPFSSNHGSVDAIDYFALVVVIEIYTCVRNWRVFLNECTTHLKLTLLYR